MHFVPAAAGGVQEICIPGGTPLRGAAGDRGGDETKRIKIRLVTQSNGKFNGFHECVCLRVFSFFQLGPLFLGVQTFGRRMYC